MFLPLVNVLDSSHIHRLLSLSCSFPTLSGLLLLWASSIHATAISSSFFVLAECSWPRPAIGWYLGSTQSVKPACVAAKIAQSTHAVLLSFKFRTKPNLFSIHTSQFHPIPLRRTPWVCKFCWSKISLNCGCRNPNTSEYRSIYPNMNNIMSTIRDVTKSTKIAHTRQHCNYMRGGVKWQQIESSACYIAHTYTQRKVSFMISRGMVL